MDYAGKAIPTQGERTVGKRPEAAQALGDNLKAEDPGDRRP